MMGRDPLNFELLRLCAQVSVNPVAGERIRALARRDVDWHVLISSAYHHRVLPLLHRTLERVASDLVPAAAMRSLRLAASANARRNLRLTGELLGVLDLLRAHNIPCIPYKGPVVAARVYGDISLRQFADLDVFVRRDDVQRAKTLLVSRGYGAGDKSSTDKDVNLRRDDLDVELEVHWRVTSELDPIQLPDDVLWADLCTFSLAGRPVLAHPREHLLLIHCIHGARHGWEKLQWVCDVAEMVRAAADVDWDKAIRIATDAGGRRIVLHGLGLARDLLEAELPPKVLREIDDPVVTSLSEQVKGWLSADSPVPLGELQRYFMRLRERPADKLRVALTQAKTYLALTSRDAEAFPVPRALSWTLYIFRPFRLAREYGLSPFLRFVKGVFQA